MPSRAGGVQEAARRTRHDTAFVFPFGRGLRRERAAEAGRARPLGSPANVLDDKAEFFDRTYPY